MLIVGVISSREEAEEITYMAKCFVVGRRARVLGRLSRLGKKSRKVKRK